MTNSDKVEEFLNSIYALKYIIRYNNLPKISNESVAEHSFFVSSITLKLSELYEFNLETALTMAITHDYVEIFISDVPRNVKDKYPSLNETLALVERQAWVDKFPEYNSLNEEFEAKETDESKIVQLADSLSVLQYVYTEVNLGNEGYMLDVFYSVSEIIKEKFMAIEYMEKSYETR